MRTTLGDLVSQLVDNYERIYHDHELAAVATSVTLEEILQGDAERRRREHDATVRIRKIR